jgi:hypothetical protein
LINLYLTALHIHSNLNRPYQRRGYGNITDEFKQGLKEAEERENTKKTKKKD